MKPTSSQLRSRRDDPPAGWDGGTDEPAEALDNQSAGQAIYPQGIGGTQGIAGEGIPSGRYPEPGGSRLPPQVTATGRQEPPPPSRASAGVAATEIISTLPDRAAPRRRHQRNRRPPSPLKLLATALAVQLVIAILGVAIFGGAIRSWLRDGGGGVPAVEPLDAEEAVALREQVELANNSFASFTADLETVKTQISLSPGDAWKQLEILGERNHLTSLADDAIANGSREAFDHLVALSEDRSRGQIVMDGATAEILRVKNFYSSGTRLGSYTLPLATLYPSLKTPAEQALSNSQLLALLADHEKDWRVRTRAAYLLGNRRDLSVSEALVRAVESDPNLDVVKECVFTFEENTGYRAKGLFEIESLLNWWTVYQARVGARAETVGPDPS